MIYLALSPFFARSVFRFVAAGVGVAVGAGTLISAGQKSVLESADRGAYVNGVRIASIQRTTTIATATAEGEKRTRA